MYAAGVDPLIVPSFSSMARETIRRALVQGFESVDVELLGQNVLSFSNPHSDSKVKK